MTALQRDAVTIVIRIVTVGLSYDYTIIVIVIVIIILTRLRDVYLGTAVVVGNGSKLE